MALGRTQIAQLREKIYSIEETRINVLDDCWNTFQYVVNHLSEWADETTIGSELRKDLLELVNSVEKLNNSLRDIKSRTDEFIAKQENLNRG